MNVKNVICLIFTALITLLLHSCEKNIEQQEPYTPPNDPVYKMNGRVLYNGSPVAGAHISIFNSVGYIPPVYSLSNGNYEIHYGHSFKNYPPDSIQVYALTDSLIGKHTFRLSGHADIIMNRASYIQFSVRDSLNKEFVLGIKEVTASYSWKSFTYKKDTIVLIPCLPNHHYLFTFGKTNGSHQNLNESIITGSADTIFRNLILN